jgi:hypothetical protein
MNTHPDADLRTTLHRLADTATPLPVGDDLWQRGRAARRRGQVLAIAAVLAILASVGGVATLVTTTDREARTASSEEVPGGAIPSRILDPTQDLSGVPDLESDLRIGRASVAFIPSSGIPVVIGANDGAYHLLDLPGLLAGATPFVVSPDGRRLAWATPDRLRVADLETGDVLDFAHNGGSGADVTTILWLPDSTELRWVGRARGQAVMGQLDVTAPSEVAGVYRAVGRGIPSPGADVIARATDGTAVAVPFLTRGEGPGSGPSNEVLQRTLPADLYPDGASVTPLGWADDHLVVAQVYGPPGSYVEGQHLVLFTSPDRPESEWTYRIVARDIPQNAVPLSIAVDLIPDLDGTSAQQLTHDFDRPADQRDISWMIGLGVAAAIAVLLGLRRLWRRWPM